MKTKPIVTTNPTKAAAVGKVILTTFNNGGIFGQTNTPQHLAPVLAVSREDRLRFVTFSVALDYLRVSYRLYDAARATYDDPETHWVYEPHGVATASILAVTKALRKHHLAQREIRDTDVWMHLAKRLEDLYNGRVEALLESCGDSAPRILKRVSEQGFMSLSGPKVGSLWLRMLNDDAGPIYDLDQIPIPVDRHVANATFALGLVTADRTPNITELEHYLGPVQTVWAAGGVQGGFYALQLDIALWHLGRLGCSKAGLCAMSSQCPVFAFCTKENPLAKLEELNVTDQVHSS